MTQEEMNVLVPTKLREIEQQFNVTVLYAAESGSRAWGFESPDSDYDVRFIYKRPSDEYLRLDSFRDVIELPINDTWDVSGWDLTKTLRLLYKSNPTLYEWMNSPIRYLHTNFADRVKPLLSEYFSRERMMYHYHQMAQHNAKDFLAHETVKPKKYLYVLRPVCACLWVMEHDSPPPVLFSELVDAVLPDGRKSAVESLLHEKVNAPENAEIPHVKDIDSFIDDSMSRIAQYLSDMTDKPQKSWDSLNKFFVDEISIRWTRTY